jgi:hypothetical protein
MEDSLKKHLEEVYIDSSFADSLTLWDVALDSTFKDKHEFIIINKKELKEDKDPKDKNPWDYEDYNYANYYLTLNGGYSSLNFNDLNPILNARNLNPYTRNTYWGLELTTHKEGGFYSNWGFSSIFAKKYKDSTDNFFRVNPYNLHADFGIDLIKKDWFDLIPYGGIGTQIISLKETDSNTKGIFGTKINKKATGFTFAPRVGLKIQFDLDDVVFGINSSYIQNIGKTGWTEYSESINNAPKISSKGFMTGLFLGIYL